MFKKTLIVLEFIYFLFFQPFPISFRKNLLQNLYTVSCSTIKRGLGRRENLDCE